MINWNDMKMDFAYAGVRCEINADTLGIAVLLKKILETNDGTLSKIYYEGYSEIKKDDVFAKIKELDGKLIFESIIEREETGEYLFKWNDAFLFLTFSKRNFITINLVSCNVNITSACRKMFSGATFSSPAKKGHVFAIMKDSRGELTITRVGHAGMALVKENYTESDNANYDFVVKDLQSKTPSGRIVVLDGPPGCGKSTMIKGILMDVPNAMFIVVPPTMVASLGGPDLLPLLLKNRESYNKKGPTVLILEDADQCLAPRASDNISSISALLNLGDGIFGSLFDIRIIATTNAKVKDLDDAIIRDGRLSKRMNLAAKSYDESNKIFQRLIKDETKNIPKVVEERSGMKPLNEKNKFTLAEIYKLARNAGWEPEISKEELDGPITEKNRPYFDEEEIYY